MQIRARAEQAKDERDFQLPSLLQSFNCMFGKSFNEGLLKGAWR